MFRRGFVSLGVLHSSTLKLSSASSPSTNSSSSSNLANTLPLGITNCLRSLASRLPHDGVSMEQFKAYIDDDFPLLSEQIPDKESLLKVLAESSSLFRLKVKEGSNDNDHDDKEWHIWPVTETLYKEEQLEEEKESQNSKAEVLEEEPEKEKSTSIKKHEESTEKTTCLDKTASQMHSAIHNSNINVSNMLADEVRSIMEHNRLPINEDLLRANTTVPFISLNTILQSNTITQNNIDKNDIVQSLNTILSSSSSCGVQENVKQQDEKELEKEQSQKEKDESNLVLYTTIQIRPKQHTRSAYIFVDGDVLSGSDLEQMSNRMGIHPSQSHWYIFRPPVRAPLSNHDYMTHDVLPTYLCVERAVRELYMHKPDVLKDIVFMCADEQQAIYLDKISRRHVFRDANVFVCTPQQIKIVHKREVVPLNS